MAETARVRPFPTPWSIEELDECFIVRDADGQALAFEPIRRRSNPRSSPATRRGA
jgi:hypothetical protein